MPFLCRSIGQLCVGAFERFRAIDEEEFTPRTHDNIILLQRRDSQIEIVNEPSKRSCPHYSGNPTATTSTIE